MAEELAEASTKAGAADGKLNCKEFYGDVVCNGGWLMEVSKA